MKRVFLFGDMADNFEANSVSFVEAAGGGSARIALFLIGGPGWERYVPRYRDPWMHLGAAEVCPIVPVEGTTQLSDDGLACLRFCSGIFIGGGDTRQYHSIYACPEVAAIIRERHEASVPFGGASAGALIAPDACIIWGSKVTAAANEFFIRPKSHFDPAKDGDVKLKVGKGLGLLQDCIVETHFSERGGFPRLLAAMEQTRSSTGLGIDEPICLEVRDGASMRVFGRGRAYVLRRAGSLGFGVKVLEPGDELDLRNT